MEKRKMESKTTTMTIYEKLAKVQNELKAPKSQHNSFGNYNYRSCEDIVESVKPILARYGLLLNLKDDLEIVGDRIYIKATATIVDYDGNTIFASAFAREPSELKGMSDSQVTGTASSYARKYALNGLLAIDDTKDADTDAFKKQTTQNVIKTEDVKKEIEQAKPVEEVIANEMTYEEARKLKFRDGRLMGDLTREQLEAFIPVSKNAKYKKAAEIVLDAMDFTDVPPMDDDDIPF